MDGLRHLLAAGRLGIENATDALSLRRWGAELLLAAVVGMVAVICATIVAIWSALALYLALQAEFSDVAAAGLTALAFLAVVGFLVLGLKVHYGRRTPSEPPPEGHTHAEAGVNFSPANIAALIPQSRPLNAWDLATLVAVGVVSGLSRPNEPR